MIELKVNISKSLYDRIKKIADGYGTTVSRYIESVLEVSAYARERVRIVEQELVVPFVDVKQIAKEWDVI